MDMDSSILKYNEQAIFALRTLYSRYGYTRYKMSRFEEYDLYVNNKDFLVSNEVITFTDHSGRLLALKPDVTLSIIKDIPDRPGLIQKVYYNENVYRVSGNSSSFKEIVQAGLECIGDLGEYHIAEVVLLAVKSLALLSKNFVLDISHTGLIAAILDDCGLSQTGKLMALEFLQQKNLHELQLLCSQENVEPRKAAKLKALAECCGTAVEVLPDLQSLLTADPEKSAYEELLHLCKILEDSGFKEEIRLDFSVENGPKYYSGVVFKGYLDGVPTSILSGGQYDRLLRRMNRKCHAIGFAIYTDLLERQDSSGAAYDLDAVVLYNPADEVSSALIRIAQKAASKGSILVTPTLPENKTYRKLYRFENGEMTELND